MVDLATYRCRIGRFHRVRWVFDTSTLKTIGAVGFIGLLLFCSGIEINPGPWDHLEQDDLSTALIPSTWMSQSEGYQYRATLCSGNGNCLFNSCSIHLIGDESLADELRAHVARELEENASMYCQTHPHIKFVVDKNGFTEDEVLVLYQTMLCEENHLTALSEETLTSAIKNEGIKTRTEKRWCSMLHLMALSSVLKENVTSLYPDIQWCHRDLYHGDIYPISAKAPFLFEGECSRREPLIFLWSRDGNLSNTDSIFVANHVVPVFQISHKRQPDELQITEQDIIPPPKKLKQTKLNSFIQQRSAGSSASNISPRNIDELADQSSTQNIILDNTSSEITVSAISTSSSILQHSVQGTCPDLALIASKRCQLSEEQKYTILRFQSECLKTYPATGDKKKRKYNQTWEQTFSWLRYSSSADGVFCGPCFVFASTSTHAEFISKAWDDWKNAMGVKRGVLNRHDTSKIHTESLALSASFISVCGGKVPSINQSLSSAYENKITDNRNALITIIDVIIKLSTRGIALRGSWDKSAKREDSNFNYFIDWLSTCDYTLEKHLKTAARNAIYLSPQIQNEPITCIGEYIRQTIVSNINKSKFFSIMADETTDSGTTEQLSICARYLDSRKNEVCEDFLGFVPLVRTDAETITNEMVKALRMWNLDLSKWRGKGFDGASTMSGNISGVQTRITTLFPHAKYFTHCKSHCLNLVIVASCTKVPEIRNFMNTFKEMTLFFKYSAKRKEILKTVMSDKSSDLLEDCLNDTEEILFMNSIAKRSLPTLSDTRWLSRVDSLGTLLVHYEHIFEALHEIKDASAGQSSYDASGFLQAMENFDFIIAAVLTQHVLGYIRPLSVNLQAKDCDLLKAHTEARNIIEIFQKLRSENGTWDSLFNRAENIAASILVTPCKPRTTGRQKHRANAGNSETVKDYFRINYYYPFLDHIVQHFNERFPEELHDVLNGCLLLPGNIQKLTPGPVIINNSPCSTQNSYSVLKLILNGEPCSSHDYKTSRVRTPRSTEFLIT